MKLNKKYQVIALAIVLTLVIVGGTVLLFSSGGTKGNSELNDTSVINNMNMSLTEYYEETKLGGYAPAILSVDGALAYPKMENGVSGIYNAESGDLLFEIPQEIADQSSYVYINNTSYFESVKYDKAKKSPIYQRHNSEGQQVGEDIVLQGFDGLVYNENYVGVGQLMSDEKYIYVILNTKTHPKLYVYNMDGTVKAAYENASISHIDGNGILYLASYTDGVGGVIKKINIEDGAVLYEIPHMRNFGVFMGVTVDEVTATLYAMDTVGIKVYDEKTGEFIRDLMEFGVDSSFVVDNNGRSNGFKIAADREVVINITHEDIEDSGIYKYKPTKGTRPIRAVTLTITAPYRDELMYKAIKKYELDNEDQKIKYDYAAETREAYMANQEQVSGQITTGILTGDIGDIVLSGGGKQNYYDLFKTDVFMDLKSQIEQDKNYGVLNKKALDGLTINGAIRGLPMFINPKSVEVNTALANELGLKLDYDNIKWSDVLALTKVLEDKGSKACVMTSTQTKDSHMEIIAMLVANMPSLIDTDKKTADLKQEWFLDLLKQWKECLNSPNFINHTNSYDMTDNLHGSLFVERSTTKMNVSDKMYLYGAYNQLPGKGSIYIPSFVGEKSSNRVAYTSSMYSISNKSENKEDAWRFLQFLIEEKTQTMNSPPGIPINMEAQDKVLERARKNKESSFDDRAKAYVEQDKKISLSMDYMYDMGWLKDDILQQLIKYFNDEQTLEQAIIAAEKAVMIRMNE